MRIIKEAITVGIDIDDTLALWVNNHDGPPRYEPNHALINEIRKHKQRGHFVIGWSAGGVDWAASVIGDLDLTYLFDLVMAKPAFMWDDKDPREWTRLCYVK